MLRLSQRHTQIAVSAATAILVLLLIFLTITRLLGYVAPFLIAILITSVIERPVRFLQKRVKLSRGLSVGLVMLAFTVVTGTIVVFLFYRLLLEVWNITKDSPSINQLVIYGKQLIAQSETLYLSLPEELILNIQTNLDTISRTIIGWINGLLNLLLRILQSLPLVFLYIIISLVSAFFMSRDREKIARFVFAQMPESWAEKLRGIKKDLFQAMAGYAKAQLMLISITFLQVLIGYSLMGIQYAFFLAIITAIFDLLPVIGPGTIIIPSAILYMLGGRNDIAFFFILLYLSVLIVRQFLEPRIVGGSIGLHPLVTLMFIFIGFRLFGVLGIILGPVMAIFIKSLQKAKILPQFKG